MLMQLFTQEEFSDFLKYMNLTPNTFRQYSTQARKVAGTRKINSPGLKLIHNPFREDLNDWNKTIYIQVVGGKEGECFNIHSSYPDLYKVEPMSEDELTEFISNSAAAQTTGDKFLYYSIPFDHPKVSIAANVAHIIAYREILAGGPFQNPEAIWEACSSTVNGEKVRDKGSVISMPVDTKVYEQPDQINANAVWDDRALKSTPKPLTGEKQVDSTSERAQRFNTGKVEWSLMDYPSMEPMIKVLMFGAKKYAKHNWKKGFDRDQLLESMQRHLAALMSGEEIDPESGESHMAHVQCNAMFYNYHFVIDPSRRK